jgi:hypothetical protein
MRGAPKSGWFITRDLKGGQETHPQPGASRNCKILNNFPAISRLTLVERETYTLLMGKVTASLAILALGLAALLASPTLQAQALQRAIYASAVDQTGAPVPNLGPADFIVREDKVAREILRVEPANDPMQIALLVDNSQAGEPYIRDYREALPAFIRAIGDDETGAKHQIGVFTLADRPTINTDYTFTMQQAVAGASRIFAVPGSGAYLLDGIIETSRGIVRKNLSRPVIVAVATEGPELSDRQYTTVLEPLRQSGAAFYVVTVGNPQNTSYDRSIVIEMGTRDTGGHHDVILTGSALTGRLKQLAVELTHQYRVTYARPDSLIPPDQVTIAAARPGLTVRGTPMKATRERQ